MPLARLLLILLVACAAVGCHRGDTTSGAPSKTEGLKSQGTAGSTGDLAYVCPMDRDIRSNGPGKCPRCGMQLVAGIPEPTEYHLHLTVAPRPPRPQEKVHLTFEVFDPWKGNRVEKFSVVHEKLFHAFIVSRDLQFFVHDHPTWANGSFHYDIAFPKPGMYRVLGDFYPEAATPQLATDTVFVAGTEPRVNPLKPDDSAKQAENLNVEMSINPPEAVAGSTTQIRFKVTPADGLQRYLGAWSHMLAASDDLIDMLHMHPSVADGGPEMQFNVVFPRPHIYRLWVQFQRNGIVNTAHFDVPVETPQSSAGGGR